MRRVIVVHDIKEAMDEQHTHMHIYIHDHINIMQKN